MGILNDINAIQTAGVLAPEMGMKIIVAGIIITGIGEMLFFVRRFWL